ncbi:MAG: NAD(P)H-binding protein [Gemmatimonadaceae bacterium]|nr:NAD(P)H-binding protein [Gemmatimonadaceae bacterium]
MIDSMIVVLGATGNTGRLVASHLLDAGRRVRVVGRSADRLRELTARGAEAAVGDLADVDFLSRAFAGAGSAYLMVPPNATAPDFLAYSDDTVTGIVRAARAARLPYAVLLSSLGADQLTGTGPIRGLHAAEARLANLSGLTLVTLRAAYFMENQFGSLGMIKHMGINGGVIAPDLRMPMIATADIARVAADTLMERTGSGVIVRELLGSRDVTMREVTTLLGAAIGAPDLPYVPFADADFIGGLIGAGISPDMAALYAEMSHAINDGRANPLQPRTAESTTPTTIEAFMPSLAAAYRQL